MGTNVTSTLKEKKTRYPWTKDKSLEKQLERPAPSVNMTLPSPAPVDVTTFPPFLTEF